jgi:AcrR family transcriptional regulator
LATCQQLRSLDAVPHAADARNTPTVPGAPSHDIAADRRRRLRDAIVVEVAERGYAATSVAHVIGRAGVSRKSFYELYDNKEACFLDACDEAAERIRALFADSCDDTTPHVAKVEQGLGALLDCCAAEPAFARTFVVESLSAGDAARERREAAIRDAARRLAPRGSPDGLLPEAVAGGIWAILYSRIARGETEQLPRLRGELMNAGLRQLAAESVP